jgi:hypothetical protein
LRGVGGRLLLLPLGPRLGLVRLCGGERLVGERELCVGNVSAWLPLYTPNLSNPMMPTKP